MQYRKNGSRYRNTPVQAGKAVLGLETKMALRTLSTIANPKSVTMSQAFVRESDEQWLHEVQPTLNALLLYLTRENNGVRVYEQQVSFHPKTGKEIYHMSNGLSYTKDDEGRWSVA